MKSTGYSTEITTGKGWNISQNLRKENERPSALLA